MVEVLVLDVLGELKSKEFASLFEVISRDEYSFFLDSGCDPGKLGRYSIIGCEPQLVFRSRGDEIELHKDGRVKRFRGDPLHFLKEIFSENKVDYSGKLPFVSGAVGYISYDFGWLTEKISFKDEDDVGMWDVELGFYDTVCVCDNLSGKKYLASSGSDKEDCLRKIREFQGKLLKENIEPQRRKIAKKFQVKSNYSKKDYFNAVEKIRDYIRAGDVYQVNLSQRFSAEIRKDPWTLYKKLRTINPAPFAAYLNFNGTQILSSSPERFLKIRNGVIETRPIKGTRPRGKTKKEDEALSFELSTSEKDKAEHVMIVDLERNDLGKVCEYGSVYVAEFEVVESYATVHHMVSTVRGKLRAGVSLVDCLRATFPGGSITGAPKVRAMEIIDELEPVRRGLYTGAIGYFGFNGAADLNIVIRTMIAKDGKIYFNAGGGVVYDSKPKEEYEETLDKAKALFQSLTR